MLKRTANLASLFSFFQSRTYSSIPSFLLSSSSSRLQTELTAIIKPHHSLRFDRRTAFSHMHFLPKISDITHIATYNKGTAFTAEEREKFKLWGLLPPRIESLEEQLQRALNQMRSFKTQIEKHVYLISLHERNETLFYKLITENLTETLPIVYTPTVGEACIKFGAQWRNTNGMYFTKDDKGKFRKILDNWPEDRVDIIVVTDGSRILGLGDLGANGMGIPIGKLSLYVAGAGFHPASTLPIQLDFGTNTESILNDPFYLGKRHKRLPEEEYLELVEEFMTAVYDKWPNVLVQFEDFQNEHAFLLLEKYRDRFLCFNDDIQGTGAVVLSGFINCMKVANVPLKDSRVIFYGAGSAGIGVADRIVSILEEAGLTNEEARRCFWLVDTKGLVTNNRGDKLQSHKIPYARHDCEHQIEHLVDIIRYVKPNALIGLSGTPQAFTEEVIKEMTKYSNNPIIMALSNPTSKAECTAKQAYEWSDGKALFASGSPFDPVEYKGKLYVPGQGNNMYIFPGLGFGSVLCKAKKVSDSMILAAAKRLAASVTPEEISKGLVYPKLDKIREISTDIAADVIRQAFAEGLAQIPRPDDIREFVASNEYIPVYE